MSGSDAGRPAKLKQLAAPPPLLLEGVCAIDAPAPAGRGLSRCGQQAGRSAWKARAERRRPRGQRQASRRGSRKEVGSNLEQRGRPSSPRALLGALLLVCLHASRTPRAPPVGIDNGRASGPEGGARPQTTATATTTATTTKRAYKVCARPGQDARADHTRGACAASSSAIGTFAARTARLKWSARATPRAKLAQPSGAANASLAVCVIDLCRGTSGSL